VSALFTVVLWVNLATALTCMYLGYKGRIGRHWADGVLAFGETVIAGWALAAGEVLFAWFSAILAVILAVSAWNNWNRRKRRRAPRTLGAKSRARIAAMVTRMRERPARRALRPVHGGAR